MMRPFLCGPQCSITYNNERSNTIILVTKMLAEDDEGKGGDDEGWNDDGGDGPRK